MIHIIKEIQKEKSEKYYMITHHGCCTFVCAFSDFNIITTKNFEGFSIAEIRCPKCSSMFTFQTTNTGITTYGRSNIKEISVDDYNEYLSKKPCVENW
jgi:hypothetical protein